MKATDDLLHRKALFWWIYITHQAFSQLALLYPGLHFTLWNSLESIKAAEEELWETGNRK